jgi:small-conductance mechanosensitive channel
MNYILNLNYKEILDLIFWNNTVGDYLIAFGVFVLALIGLKIFKKIVLAKVKKIVNHTITDFDDLIIKTVDSIGWPFYLFFSLYFALRFINIPNILERAVFYLLLIIGVYYIVNGLQEIIDYGFKKIVDKRSDEKRFDPTMINLLRKITRIILWGLALIIFLQNLGYNISALVAGLGIGGLAIAFALQNILADIFASFTIYFDKPFEVGDFVIIGKDMGTIKKIGIKSTRIQALQGEELVVSNKELTESRINNYKKMEKRRIVFNFGVVYSTSTEKLRKIPQIVKEIINQIELVELDRVHFNNLGDSSLNFEVVYYLKSKEYNDYMDIQEKINFSLKECFEKEEIEFAYPTQTVFINK